MRELVIEFQPTGKVLSMHQDEFDLGFLGNKRIRRQTEIVFRESNQKWGIKYLIDGDTDCPVIAPALEEFDGYEEARNFEVRWVNQCRLYGISPASIIGLEYAKHLRNMNSFGRCFTLPNGECMGDGCIHCLDKA